MTGLGVRRPREDDAARVAALMTAAERADGIDEETTAADVLEGWRRLDRNRDAWVVERAGGSLAGYVDATVIAERPRLAPHIDRMRESIAAILGVGVGAISVKATTNERLGEIGAGEAIAVTAVALLEQDVP